MKNRLRVKVKEIGQFRVNWNFFSGSFKLKPKSLVFILGLLGFSSIYIFSYQVGKCNPKIFGTLLFLSISFMMIGGILGLIFGIPKTNKNDSNQEISVNTNLEEISDWLTKIIIGLGIAQLYSISGNVEGVVSYISDLMPCLPRTGILSVVIFFPIYGFISSWLLTRIHLTELFANQMEKLRNNYSDLFREAHKVLANANFDAEEKDIPSITGSMKTSEIVSKVKFLEENNQPIDAEVYKNLGIILFSKHNYEMAAQYFEKAFNLNNDYKSLVNLGVVFSVGYKNYEEAIKIYERALSEQPNFPLALYNLACSQIKLKKLEDGLNSLEKALILGGDDFMKSATKDSTFLSVRKEQKFKNLVPDYSPEDDHQVGS